MQRRIAAEAVFFFALLIPSILIHQSGRQSHVSPENACLLTEILRQER